MKGVFVFVILFCSSLFVSGQTHPADSLPACYFLTFGLGWSVKENGEMVNEKGIHQILEFNADSTLVIAFIDSGSDVSKYELGRWELKNDTIVIHVKGPADGSRFIRSEIVWPKRTLLNLETRLLYGELPAEEKWIFPEFERYHVFAGIAEFNNGKAIFIPEFADSAVYTLEGLTKWEEGYLNKPIKVYGYLEDGVLKNWTIIE